MKIRGVVFDWAGTIIDFGSLAPMGAFVQLFSRHGVAITIAQARIPMGLPKLAHIEALGAMPEVAQQWLQVKGRMFSAEDACALLVEFEPMSAKAALEHSDFIPGFLDTHAWLCEHHIGIASTTGYTRKIMTPLIAKASALGFNPRMTICCDDVEKSRPDPMGMYQCMQALELTGQGQCIVKVDDTQPGLQEALNAGCWTVGVAASGNALGWSLSQWTQASKEARDTAVAKARMHLLAVGAHDVVDTVAQLPDALQRINARLQNGERPLA
jgi:phosphonoacetaldehyde hydrolase